MIRTADSSAKHPLDLSACEIDMHRAAVRAVSLELSAIEIGEQLTNFPLLERAPDSDRTVTRELLEPFLERALARRAKPVLAHAIEHVGEQLRAAFRTEDRRGSLE